MWGFTPEKDENIIYQDNNCIWIKGRFEGYACNAIVTSRRFVIEQHASPTAPLLIQLILPMTRQRVIFEVPLRSLKSVTEGPDGKGKGVHIETRFDESGKLRTDNVAKFMELLSKK